MTAPCSCPATRLVFCVLHTLQRALLLGQRRPHLAVRIVLAPALGAQLRHRCREMRLAEALGAQLAGERQARRGEQHLLAYGRRVRHVGDGDEAIGRAIMPAQDQVRGFGGCKEGVELREVVEEVAVLGGDGLRGDDLFAADCSEAAARQGT